jgi:hypothetical protein
MRVGRCPVCEFALHDTDDGCPSCGSPLVERTPPTATSRWLSWPIGFAVLSVATTLALAVSGRLVALLVALAGRN